MPREKRKVLKNKPSTKVNEIKIDPPVVEDLRVQKPMSPHAPVMNTYGIEPSGFHARRTVSNGAAKLIEAAEEYETFARLLRNTANSLNRVHE